MQLTIYTEGLTATSVAPLGLVYMYNIYLFNNFVNNGVTQKAI